MMDAAERDLLARGLRRATAAHSGAALDTALADMGWPDALADDPPAAVSALFEAQGAANATSSAIDAVLVLGLGLPPDPATAVVLPATVPVEPPGRLEGDHLSVGGFATARLADTDQAVVVAADGGAGVAVTVKTADLDLRPVAGMDPGLGLVAVGGTTTAAARHRLPSGAWTAAAGLGQLALGHELVGAAGAMLELACTHARERIQFGQPIASFQAVRHRLAETLVAVEAARAALDAAWEDRSPQNTAMAKAAAGIGARTAARHCQQVLAGIGFTAEHPFHRFLRRTLVLDELLGSARSLTRALGEEVLASRRLPPHRAL